MSDHKGELVIVENGAIVPGEIRAMNKRVETVLIKASVEEERLVDRLEALVAVRHQKLSLAIERLERMNAELDHDLAAQVSEG
jgi:hypothetical protein